MTLLNAIHVFFHFSTSPCVIWTLNPNLFLLGLFLLLFIKYEAVCQKKSYSSPHLSSSNFFYCKRNAKMPDFYLQVHSLPNVFIFGYMSFFFLMKLRWNCLGILTIVTFGGKRGVLISLITQSLLWNMGIAASCYKSTSYKRNWYAW